VGGNSVRLTLDQKEKALALADRFWPREELPLRTLVGEQLWCIAAIRAGRVAHHPHQQIMCIADREDDPATLLAEFELLDRLP
jgi:hypothetical protein